MNFEGDLLLGRAKISGARSGNKRDIGFLSCLCGYMEYSCISLDGRWRFGRERCGLKDVLAKSMAQSIHCQYFLCEL